MPKTRPLSKCRQRLSVQVVEDINADYLMLNKRGTIVDVKNFRERVHELLLIRQKIKYKNHLFQKTSHVNEIKKTKQQNSTRNKKKPEGRHVPKRIVTLFSDSVSFVNTFEFEPNTFTKTPYNFESRLLKLI